METKIIMVGKAGRSGRKTASMERRASKLEWLAVNKAINIFETGTEDQQFELTKTIAPKVISQIREHKSESGPRKITIEFVRRGELTKEPVCIDITPRTRTESTPNALSIECPVPTITMLPIATETIDTTLAKPIVKDIDQGIRT